MIEYISNTIQAHVVRENSENDYEFLILKRSNYTNIYPGIWQVITGTIRENEKALDCAIRELLEETSLSPIKIWKIPYVALFYNHLDNRIHTSPVFGFLVDKDAPVIISKEHLEFKWLKFNDLLQLLQLPSHIEGTKIFYDYILSKNSQIYQI
ncbi:MAG: NUDIX domain-containing protein [Candidatus Kapabacteria bacterium]|nr:NUDIX domain-containing protein [Candidatus Kapabacteria bacterium]